jgi:predicted dehydrogenase
VTVDDPLAVGVVGVGSMGRNHARVYSELPDVDLVGVADVDRSAAEDAAATYGTEAMGSDRLLAAVDAVSVAVPTRYHYEAARECIDRGVGTLVEKPFVHNPDRGRALAERARAAGVPLQVGHVERFNPAVRTLAELVPDLEVLAVDAERLGPPVGRDVDRSAVFDLMIHDIDVMLSLFDGEPRDFSAVGTADNRLTTAIGRIGDVTTTLTASRVTQRKVRRLGVTARECRVCVDYIDQSVEIHMDSHPEYVVDEGSVRHRVDSVVERPTVSNGEPLKHELSAFVDVVREGAEPPVTAADGVRAVELATRIDRLAAGTPEVRP